MANSDTHGIGRTFGQVLKACRMELGVSQEELAHRAEVDRTFVSRLERGIRQPTITTLFGLGAALGLPASELVRKTEEQLRHSEDLPLE